MRLSDAELQWMQTRLAQRYAAAGREAQETLERKLAALPPDQALLTSWCYAASPLSDWANYDFSLFSACAAHALFLREQSPEVRALPEQLFLNYVLHPRVNEEELCDCRGAFYAQLEERIRGRSAREAILAINFWNAEQVCYRATDARTISALGAQRSGFGRCGEESAFAVNALRAVGIPARQVYTPRWAHCDDNHAWVEAFCDGAWHYLGACEPEPELDRGWFTGAASRAILVHSRLFGRPAPDDAVISEDGAVTFFEPDGALRARAPADRARARAGRQSGCRGRGDVRHRQRVADISRGSDPDGQPRRGAACLRLWRSRPAGAEERMVLRSALPGRAADARADARAAGSAVRPLGSVHDPRAEGAAARAEAASTRQKKRAPQSSWQRQMKNAASARKRRMTRPACRRCARSLAMARRSKPFCVRPAGILMRWQSFWRSPRLARRRSLRFCRRSPKKDLRDVRPEVLREALALAADDLPQDVRALREILCPRIGTEPLARCRAALLERVFAGAETGIPQRTGTALAVDPGKYPVRAGGRIPAADNAACRRGAPALRRSARAQRLLFVAACRALGVAARLDPHSGAAEYRFRC